MRTDVWRLRDKLGNHVTRAFLSSRRLWLVFQKSLKRTHTKPLLVKHNTGHGFLPPAQQHFRPQDSLFMGAV
jgi:hypothetical protein